MTEDADVIIVGFGPTGAALAGLLARHGLRVNVLEMSEEVFALPRAAHIDHTGLRTLQEIGCLDELLPAMVRNESLDLVNRDHELLMRLPAGQRSVSGLPTSVYFYQPHLDQTLCETVEAIDGVTVHRGAEAKAFTQDANGVTVEYQTMDGRTHQLRGAWLVGCDGSWSMVREALGIKLESLNFDEQWLVLDLTINNRSNDLPGDRVVQICDPARPHLTTPISAGRQRFEFMVMPDDDIATIREFESVKALLAPWLSPEDFGVERSAIYTFHGLIAERWRSGRVLLAGDAAHQMPPFLGQGMCSGLRDASNLAWKLARVVRQEASADLVDTYDSERMPHVKRIIEAAIGFGRMVCITDERTAQARDHDLMVKRKIPDPVANFALPRLTEGALVDAAAGMLFIQPIEENVRFDDEIGNRFLVLGRTEEALGDDASWWREVAGAVTLDLSKSPRQALTKWLDRYESDVAIVRPDRYVMYVGKDISVITRRAKELLAPASVEDEQIALLELRERATEIQRN